MGKADEAAGDAMHRVCDSLLLDAGKFGMGLFEKSGDWLELARSAI